MTQRLNPLIAVIAWELRRLRANRRNWLLAGGVLLFCMALMGFKNSWARPVTDGAIGETVLIVGTSAIGLPYLIIFSALFMFGLVIPFISTEGVARDYKERMHELLMTTPVTAPIYVLGRFLAVLLVNLGLALLLLASVLATTWFLHLTQIGYPLPDLGLIVGIWTLAVVPATVAISGVSFALGTSFPRSTNAIKALVLAGWVGLTFTADVFDHGGTWFTYWSPTSYGIVRVNVDRFLQEYQDTIRGVGDLSQHVTIALQLQSHLPSLAPWIFPHLILIVLSFALVLFVAVRFRRFGELMG